MTKFELPSFNSGANSKKYRDNWEKVFGKKEEEDVEEDDGSGTDKSDSDNPETDKEE